MPLYLLKFRKDPKINTVCWLLIFICFLQWSSAGAAFAEQQNPLVGNPGTNLREIKLDPSNLKPEEPSPPPLPSGQSLEEGIPIKPVPGSKPSTAFSEISPEKEAYVQGEWLVQFRKDAIGIVETARQSLDAMKDAIQSGVQTLQNLWDSLKETSDPLIGWFKKLGVKAIRKVFAREASSESSDLNDALNGSYLINFDDAGMADPASLELSSADARVLMSSRNYKTYLADASSSSIEDLLNQQNQAGLWGLHQIDVETAWQKFDKNHNGIWDAGEKKPGEGVTVAIIDGGIYFNHPDLFQNVRVNSQEISYAVGDRNRDGVISYLDADFNGDGRVTLLDLDGLKKKDGILVWEKIFADGKVSEDEISLVTNGIDDDLNGYPDDILGMNSEVTQQQLEKMSSHGTHIAGTVAGRGEQPDSIVGVAPYADLMQVKIFNTGDVSTRDTDVLEGIRYAIDNGANILNLSLGGYIPKGSASFKLFEKLTEYAASKNVLIVAAAGNEHSNSNTVGPANVPGVFTVAAVDRNEKKADFSNYGFAVEIAAPGVNILSSVLEGTALNSGTSMASPHVAGAAALLASYFPAYSIEQIKQSLQQSATPYESPNYAGWGILNIGKALDIKPSATATGQLDFKNLAVFEKNQTIAVNLSALKGKKIRLEWGSSGGNPAIGADKDSLFMPYAHPPSEWSLIQESAIVSERATIQLDSSKFPSSFLSATALRLTVIDESGLTHQVIRYLYVKDPASPLGQASIKGGPVAGTPNIFLLLNFQDRDSAVSEMSFSNDGKIWSPWEPYQNEKAWKLTDGLGQKNVRVKVRDAYRNEVQTEVKVELGVPQTVTLEAGGNSFSVYVQDFRTIEQIKKDNGFSDKIVFWKQTNLNSSSRIPAPETESLRPDAAYWIENDTGVKINFTLKGLSSVPEISLNQGWNITGGFEKMVLIEDLNLSVSGAKIDAFYWNREIGTWARSLNLEPGKMYALHSDKAVTLTRVIKTEHLNLDAAVIMQILFNGKTNLIYEKAGSGRLDLSKIKVHMNGSEIEWLELPVKDSQFYFQRITFNKTEGAGGKTIQSTATCREKCENPKSWTSQYELHAGEESVTQNSRDTYYLSTGKLASLKWDTSSTGELTLPLYRGSAFFAWRSADAFEIYEGEKTFILLRRNGLDFAKVDWTKFKNRTLAELAKFLEDDLLIQQPLAGQNYKLVSSSGAELKISRTSQNEILFDDLTYQGKPIPLDLSMTAADLQDKSFDFSAILEQQGDLKEIRFRITLDNQRQLSLRQIDEKRHAQSIRYDVRIGKDMSFEWRGKTADGVPVYKLRFQDRDYFSNGSGAVQLEYGWLIRPVFEKNKLVKLEYWNPKKYSGKDSMSLESDPNGRGVRVKEITSAHAPMKIFDYEHLSTLVSLTHSYFKSADEMIPVFGPGGFHEAVSTEPLVTFESNNTTSFFTAFSSYETRVLLQGNQMLFKQGNKDFTETDFQTLPLEKRNWSELLKLIKDDRLATLPAEGTWIKSSDGFDFFFSTASATGLDFSQFKKDGGEPQAFYSETQMDAQGNILLRTTEWPKPEEAGDITLLGKRLTFKTYRWVFKDTSFYLELVKSEQTVIRDAYEIHFSEGLKVFALENGFIALQRLPGKEHPEEPLRLLAPGQMFRPQWQSEAFYGCAHFCNSLLSLETDPQGKLKSLTNWSNYNPQDKKTVFEFEKDPARGGYRLSRRLYLNPAYEKPDIEIFNYEELSIRNERKAGHVRTLELYTKPEDLDGIYRLNTSEVVRSFETQPFLTIAQSENSDYYFEFSHHENDQRYIIFPVGKADIGFDTDWKSLKERTTESLRRLLQDDFLIRTARSPFNAPDWVLAEDGLSRFGVTYDSLPDSLVFHIGNFDTTDDFRVAEKDLNGKITLRALLENGNEDLYDVRFDEAGKPMIKREAKNQAPPAEDIFEIEDTFSVYRDTDGRRKLNYNNTIYLLDDQNNTVFLDGTCIHLDFESDHVHKITVFLSDGGHQELHLIKDPSSGLDHELVLKEILEFDASQQLVKQGVLDYERGLREQFFYENGKKTRTEGVYFRSKSEVHSGYFLNGRFQFSGNSMFFSFIQYELTGETISRLSIADELQISKGVSFSLLQQGKTSDIKLEQIFSLKEKTVKEFRKLLKDDVLIQNKAVLRADGSSFEIQEVLTDAIVFKDHQTWKTLRTSAGIGGGLTLEVPGDKGASRIFDVISDSKTESGVRLQLRREKISASETIYVYDHESIQQAVDQAPEGSTIVVHAGTYQENLVLRKGISLKGAAGSLNSEIILEGVPGVSEPVIVLFGNNSLEGVTVTGAAPRMGGVPSSAVRVDDDQVRISNVSISENPGYGIWIRTNGRVLIEQSSFIKNNIGVQLPGDGSILLNNIFDANTIGINVLGGKAPWIEKNILKHSTFASIYEAAAGKTPSRGYALVRDNLFSGNQETSSYYGSALPPAVEKQESGNRIEP
ncbi:MAG: hypothetical protein EXS63_04645 [Candidatus Omnitrophica bacterium]|nr:hypothetical protein [Candidatus Omnitrophota bacterium]